MLSIYKQYHILPPFVFCEFHIFPILCARTSNSTEIRFNPRGIKSSDTMPFLNGVCMSAGIRWKFIIFLNTRRLFRFSFFFFFNTHCLIKFSNYRETGSLLTRAINSFSSASFRSAVRSRIRCNNITFPSLGFYLQNYRAHLESCAIKVTHANIYLFVADVRQLYAVEVPVLHADIPHKYSPCICAMPYIRDRE